MIKVVVIPNIRDARECSRIWCELKCGYIVRVLYKHGQLKATSSHTALNSSYRYGDMTNRFKISLRVDIFLYLNLVETFSDFKNVHVKVLAQQRKRERSKTSTTPYIISISIRSNNFQIVCARTIDSTLHSQFKLTKTCSRIYCSDMLWNGKLLLKHVLLCCVCVFNAILQYQLVERGFWVQRCKCSNIKWMQCSVNMLDVHVFLLSTNISRLPTPYQLTSTVYGPNKSSITINHKSSYASDT